LPFLLLLLGIMASLCVCVRVCQCIIVPREYFRIMMRQ
jgi:hypothetical protein